MKILQTLAAFAAVFTSTFGWQAALAETSAPIKAHSNEPGDLNLGPTVVLDNKGDPNFNQLLGINDEQTIVGYFGDGTVIRNNAYVLLPKTPSPLKTFTHFPPGAT